MAEKPEATSSPQLLDRIGRILDAAHVNWATIGALAVAYHGVVRASLDAGALITLKVARLDLDALAAVLSEQGWTVDTRLGEEGDPLGFVLRISDGSGNQVDLVGGIRKLAPGFFNRAIEDEFDGMKLRIASPEDLIALKVFAGGPKDLDDAVGVLDVQGSAINRDLVLRLCGHFGLEEESRFRNMIGP